MTSRERVEVFHLLFLRSLFASLEDRSLVVLKGGGNLRFFFGSPRFSEDLDLDVRTISTRTLRGKIDGLLQEGRSLSRVLGSRGLRIASASAPKQTDEVQRWKVAIAEGRSMPEPTKIEFSRRNAGHGRTEAVPSSVLTRHALPGPIVATHYRANDAAAQKVEALLGRRVPQARDVFDLNLLIGSGAKLPALSRLEEKAASERVLAFDVSDFEGQVLAFLEPDDRAVWDSRQAIDAMQLRVVEALDSTRR